MIGKSTSAVLAASLLASQAMASTSSSVDAPWLDWTSSTTTTTTTTTKKVDPATFTSTVWDDWTTTTSTTTKSTTTTYDPWVDWTTSTTTTKKVDPAKSTSTTYVWGDWISTTTTSTTTKKPVSPATTSTSTYVWDDWSTVVDPVDPAVCEVVTVTFTGVGFWVPDPEETGTYTWDDWDTTTTTTTSSKPVKPTKSSSTSTTVDPTWSDWVSTSTTTKAATTTTAATSTWSAKPSSTTTTTTTTSAPAAAPTCPADNGKSVLAGGSCGCSYTVHCGVKASPDGANTSFWEKTSGGIVPTLAECLALCDSNDKCEAALWVDDSTSGDYHHCWQISGALGQPTGSGVAQISYKGTCSGKCTESYSK